MQNEKAPKRFNPIYTYQSTIYSMALLFVVAYSIYFIVAGIFIPFYVSLAVIILFVIILLLSIKTYFLISAILGILTLSMYIFFLVHWLGLSAGIHHYLLMVTVLISASAIIKRTPGIIISISLLMLYILLLLLYRDGKAAFEIPVSHSEFLREMNIILAFIVLALSFHRYHLALKDAESELKLYHGRVIEMANTDALTNLPNRRNVEDELIKLLQHPAVERGKGSAVAIGDLDDFKKVNDTYGHQCGDEVLKEMALRFRSCVRNYDIIGRWGGEEFLFILKDTNPEQAFDTMERIRKQATSRPVEYNGVMVDITVTFGVSHYREGDTQKTIFERVDELLYQGKKSGKNRVMADS